MSGGTSKFLLALAIGFFAGHKSLADEVLCSPDWLSANLTNYASYPEPNGEECIDYNGCAWVGQFYGLPDIYDEEWVARHNIIAVHLKDWGLLGMKILHLRQGEKEIYAQAVDACADEDCNGCCTANLGGDGYLIDIEKYTMARFGAGEGLIEFQICE